MTETTEKPPVCIWRGSDQPRAIKNRHHDTCNGLTEIGEECRGCVDCSEDHCPGDACRGRNHSATICAECLTAARDDLSKIRAMCGQLPTEAIHRGVDSEAAMLAGPAANPEAWRHTALSAMFGRLDASYLEDCRDEAHPLWVLAGIEQEWREALDQPTSLRVTIDRAGDYINRTMHIIAAMTSIDDEQPPEFADAARRLRQCRAHLEDVLSAGEREETGAPCPKCGKGALVKDYGKTDDADRWRCPNRRCREWWTDEDYRAKVGATYERHADALTASAIARVYRVSEGSVRGWASEKIGKVRKRGKDANGLQLYDVGDVVAMREKTSKKSA